MAATPILLHILRQLLQLVYYYDFPQFCFGGDGFGNYGLWFVVDYFNDTTADTIIL